MSTKFIDPQTGSEKTNVDAIWDEARHAVKVESPVVQRRVLESYWEHSDSEDR